MCQAHRDNPVHTCVEFFGPAQREWLDRVCKEQGKDLPDYTRAAWAFPQVLVPQSEVN